MSNLNLKGDPTSGDQYNDTHPTTTIAGLTGYKNAPGYTGPSSSPSYYDPATGQTSTTWTPGSLPMDRPGIDARVQGNLENPYAGYYGGAPAVAGNEESRYAGLADAARNAPGAQINNGQYNADRGLEMGSRGNQDYALGKYRDMIEGRGTSVAQAQLNQGLARSMAQQQAIAASARGGGANLVAAQQASANAAGNMSGQVAGQSALLRAQEVQGALQGYSGLASQQRAADLQRQGLSADQAYKQAQLEEQQHAINSQAGLGYEGMRQNVFGQQQQGMEWNEGQNYQAFHGGEAVGVQQDAQNTSTRNAAIAGGATAGAGILGLLSDVRKKKDIGDGQAAVSDQLAAMSPQTYGYKDPREQGAGPGQRVGVMAQDMERGPYGGQLVKNTPQGKKIDGPGGLSLALAGTANHEQRLRQLEGGAPTAPYRDMSKLTPAEWAEYTMAQNARQHGIATPADEAYVQRARAGVPYVAPPQAQGLAAAAGQGATQGYMAGGEPPPQAPVLDDSYGYGGVARDYLAAGLPGLVARAALMRQGGSR